jgi:hypothetical protein
MRPSDNGRAFFPSASAMTIWSRSFASPGSSFVCRRNVRCVPSRVKPAAKSTVGPETSVRVVPSSESRMAMSPWSSKTSAPLRAGPNGGGTWRCEPAISSAATARTRTRAATRIGRHGTDGKYVLRRAIALMGSHLSRKAQRGRCRVAAACARRSST